MRKTIINHILLPFTAVLLFASCKTYHYMYAPMATNAPMLNKKGENSFTALYTSGSIFRTSAATRNNGYDLQGAYAVSNNFAITGAFAHRYEKNVYDSTNTAFSYTSRNELLYHRNTTALGIGYFTPCNTSGSSFFDLYGGYALGRYEMNDNGTTAPTHYFHNTNINNYYVQPGFHFNTGGLQVGLATRFNITSYYNISTDYTAAQEQSYNIAVLHNTTFGFLEPSLTIRAWVPGAPWLRFDFQGATSIKLNNAAMYYRESYLSLGFSFDFSKVNDAGGNKKQVPPPNTRL